jgi:hypothetical protein
MDESPGHINPNRSSLPVLRRILLMSWLVVVVVVVIV